MQAFMHMNGELNDSFFRVGLRQWCMALPGMFSTHVDGCMSERKGFRRKAKSESETYRAAFSGRFASR